MSVAQKRALAVAGVALLLIVLVGLSLLGQPEPTQPSPDQSATLSPSPTPAAELTPDPSPFNSPTVSAPPPVTATPSPTSPAGTTATQLPSPSPDQPPSPSPVAGATPTPVAAQRDVRLVGLGLDRQGLDEARERLLTVQVDGPGTLKVELTSVSSGSVRVCTWQGTPSAPGPRECERIRRGGLSRNVAVTGPSSWTISLIGADAQSSPLVAVTLRFPARTATLSLERFRLQGQDLDGYNGFNALLDTLGSGRLTINGEIDDSVGGEYPFRLGVQDAATGSTPVEAEGVGGRLDFETDVAGPRSYRVSLESTLGIAEQEVLLRAVLSWP